MIRTQIVFAFVLGGLFVCLLGGIVLYSQASSQEIQEPLHFDGGPVLLPAQQQLFDQVETWKSKAKLYDEYQILQAEIQIQTKKQQQAEFKLQQLKKQTQIQNQTKAVPMQLEPAVANKEHRDHQAAPAPSKSKPKAVEDLVVIWDFGKVYISL